MAYVNVNRSSQDPYNRYKMPILIAKVEGKGNGIKTVIVNMVEIGKSLQRPPSYPCKYFGCELGAQTQMDPKIGRYIVNGAHDGPKLQELLDGFIKNFVLCEGCENPETVLHVQTSKGRIIQTCKACGHSRQISPRHKLTTYIIKNPPTPDGADDTGSSKKGDKKGKKSSKGKKEKEPTSPMDPPVTNDEFETATSQVKKNGSVSKQDSDDDDDEDWSVDTSEAAVKARLENLTDGANALTLNDDLEKSVTDRLNMFFEFVESFKKQGGVHSIAANLTKIKSEAERLEVFDTAAGIMCELLYTDKLLTEIKQYRPIILHFVHENKKAQRTVLDAFEILVCKIHPGTLMCKAPHILKAFYDEDILEEEAIYDWFSKPSKKKVDKEKAREIRDKVAPVIEWLKTAEEETDEEEDDDDNVEVVYSDKQQPSKLSVITETTSAPEHSNDDDNDDDEVNIDDI